MKIDLPEFEPCQFITRQCHGQWKVVVDKHGINVASFTELCKTREDSTLLADLLEWAYSEGVKDFEKFSKERANKILEHLGH